jgi:hypothetical protein
MSDIAVWTLTKNGHGARAVTRQVPRVGIELRYYWDSELRQAQVYRDTAELAEAANKKREQLLDQGWREVPPIAWGN